MRSLLWPAVALLASVLHASAASLSLQAQEPIPSAPSMPRTTDGLPGLPSDDTVKTIAKEGGQTLVIVLLLVYCKREYDRRLDTKQSEVDALREERRGFTVALDKHSELTTTMRMALVDNTNVTRQLSSSVDRLAERCLDVRVPRGPAVS
jgi:hypothetical protein